MPWLRIVSGVFLAPLALLAVWAGGYWYGAMLAIVGALMVWEWERICRGRFSVTGGGLAVVVCVVGFLSVAHFLWALVLIGVAAMGVAIVSRSGWLISGAFYVGLPIVAMAVTRSLGGDVVVYWLLGIVWATDIGGYVFGRAIGGPRLAVRISPNKTWAGLVGGVICAAAMAFALSFVFILPFDRRSLVAISVVLAVVAQGGDLFESSVKRRFKVKDSSHIIPGHGGVLDRVDGLIAVAPVIAVMLAVQARGEGLWW